MEGTIAGPESISHREEAPTYNPNWKLISFRWVILLSFISCFYCQITDIMHHSKMLSRYSQHEEAEFTKFESLVLASNVGIILVLTVGVLIVLKQNVQHLRTYLTMLFLSSWLQMLLIIVLTQRYPLARGVHLKWEKRESLETYETSYKCCGVFGPDDYMLEARKLPRSCFADGHMESKYLNSQGCLNKDNVSTSIFCIELITCLCQFILNILLICHYFYLKQIKPNLRSFRDVYRAGILF